MDINNLIQQLAPKSIWHVHPPLQKAVDDAQKIKRGFFFIEGIQQRKFDIVMAIDATTGNDLVRQQRLANMTYVSVVKQVIIERTVLIQLT